MKCTVDWFAEHVPVWRALTAHLAGTVCNVLEVGSLEGVSAVWMLENICTHPDSRLVCVDPWDERCAAVGPGELRGAESVFDSNVAPYGRRCVKLKGDSADVLPTLRKSAFDLVYVDGDHEGKSVLMDGALAWRLLRPGGLMCFDDYTRRVKYAEVQPREAVDAFVRVWRPKTVHVGSQVWVRR